jgi:hypothetical protein
MDRYFVPQRLTAEENEYAFSAVRICCVVSLRYGGIDSSIIQRRGDTPEHSDSIAVLWRLMFVEDHRRIRSWQRGWRWIRPWSRNEPPLT